MNDARRNPSKTATTSALLILVILAAMAGSASFAGGQAHAAPAGATWTASVAPASVAPASIAPAPAARAAAALPQAACTLAGTTRTCDLWAKSGTLALPGLPAPGTVPIWGFASTDLAAAVLPGPVVEANAGETLELVLHNGIAGENLALAFPGLDGWLPDLAGIPAGGSKSYSVTLTEPGTFLYEAGLTANGPRQVAMGLAGVIIVRPAAGGCTTTCAYDDASTYDTEEVVVLSEVDPALNANPTTFRMEEFNPSYRLINGKAYPQTDPIAAAPATTVLVRYANVGALHHPMALLGVQQTVVGRDGVPLAHLRRVVSELVWPGQTIDALLTVPAAAVDGTKYALYDASMRLDNAGQFFGGMMTFVEVASAVPGPDAGPATTAVSVTPNRTTGVGGVTLAATLDDTGSADPDNIVAAEYFVDTVTADGTGILITGFAEATVTNVSVLIDETTLAGWTSADHTLYVHGQDVHGTWGPVGSTVLRLDYVGPDSTGLNLSPNPSSGNAAVALQATGDDTVHGNGNVIAAQYTLDGGGALNMTLNRTNQPTASLTATIDQATMAGLAEGEHVISVTSQDDLLNWGAASTIGLKVDQTGPTASALAVSPASLTFPNPAVGTVRLTGTVSDPLSGTPAVQSTVATAEGFIDVLGTAGTGFAMFPADGLFNGFSEAVYYDIPVANFSALSEGVHNIYIRGRDASGNWGLEGSTTITINKGAVNDTAPPALSALSVTPATVNAGSTTPVILTGVATDSVSNIAAGQWALSTAGPWNGMSAQDGTFDAATETLTASIDVSGWTKGRYTIYVRAQDAAGNWSTPGKAASVVLRVR